MKKLIWIIVLVLVLVGIMALSGGDKTPVSSDEPIKIGVSLPLTGNSASIGERVKNGIDLAVREVNAKGSWQLVPVLEDDKGESAPSVSAVNKLISVDGVKIIVGLLKSDPLLAVAPIVEENQVVLLSPTAGAASITQAGDYVFRNIETPDIHGQRAANFFQSKGIKRAALFMAQASNAQSYADAFKKNFDPLVGQVVSTASYLTEMTDFRTDIAKAKAAGAEAIYIGVATAKDGGLVVKQARENGFTGLIMVSIAADAPEFISIAGQAAEGVVISAAPFNAEDPAASQYAANYRSQYGKESDGFAANGYDAIWLIANAIENCNGDNSECVRDFLYQVKDYPGVGGLTTFDQNGDVIKPVQLKVVKDGHFIKLEE